IVGPGCRNLEAIVHRSRQNHDFRLVTFWSQNHRNARLARTMTGSNPALSARIQSKTARRQVTKPFLLFLTAVLLAFALNAPAAGESFPAKPVRLVVPFPAGGGSDNVGRVLAQKLSEVLGQQVFVENRSGAGGS